VSIGGIQSNHTRQVTGVACHPLGGLSFANWAREVAAQETEHDLFFDLENRNDRNVIGIDASATLDQTRSQASIPENGSFYPGQARLTLQRWNHETRPTPIRLRSREEG
jgi:1-aminocyclopropane-1-carboxylate deaminase/D-cysteine desulfhydrase-like pyridoxal-dependent ACC family enzyme